MAAGGRRVSYIAPELLQIIEDSVKTSTGYYMYEYNEKNDGKPSIEINFNEHDKEMQKVIIMSSSILSLPRFSVSFYENYRKGSKPAGTMDNISILFSKEKIGGRDIINLDQTAKNTDIYLNIQKFIDLLVELKICPDDLPEDFKRISTKGDGNCLFNAISYQLGQETPQEVRRNIGTSQKMKTTDGEWGMEDEVINASKVYNRTVIWFTYLGGILRFHIVKKATLTKPIVLFNCNLREKNKEGNHWETIEISDERIQYIYLLYSLYMSVYDEPQVEGYIFLKFRYEYNIVPQALFDSGIDRSNTLLYQKTPRITKTQNTDKNNFNYFIYYNFENRTPLLFFSNSIHCPHCFNILTNKYVCDTCRKRIFVSTVSYFVEDLTLEDLKKSGYIDENTRLFKPDFQTLCNRKSEPNIPSGELLFKDEKCSQPISLFTRIENRYRYRYNVSGFNISLIRDILIQLPKIWKDGDLILYNTQSLKRSNTPTDVWKSGKEPGMLYPINLVHKPFFELHLDKNDNPLFLYSNIDLPLQLESQFRKSKKLTRSKSLKSLKSLKNKKTNKSKSLKKLKNKKTNKSKSLKNKKTNKFN